MWSISTATQRSSPIPGISLPSLFSILSLFLLLFLSLLSQLLVLSFNSSQPEGETMHLRAFIKRWTAYKALSSSSNSSTDDLAPTSDASDNKNNKRRSFIDHNNRSFSSSSSSSPPSLSPSRSAPPSPMPSPSRSPEPVQHLPATSSNLRKKARKASSTPSTRYTTPVKGGNGSSIGNGREKASMETPPLSCCSKEIAEDPCECAVEQCKFEMK